MSMFKRDKPLKENMVYKPKPIEEFPQNKKESKEIKKYDKNKKK